MNVRTYLGVSGCVFGAVTLLHLARVMNGWAFQLGTWAVPPWVSGLGVLAAGLLCLSAFRLLPRAR